MAEHNIIIYGLWENPVDSTFIKSKENAKKIKNIYIETTRLTTV